MMIASPLSRRIFLSLAATSVAGVRAGDEGVQNNGRVPFKDMSPSDRDRLLRSADRVQWWSRDANGWTQPSTAPRNWKHEAYRLPAGCGL